MPTYEYSCRSCNRTIEVFQSMKDDPLTTCPECGQEGLKRLIGRGSGIIFKGSGFYQTDYKSPASNENKKEASGGSESAAKADAKKDSATTTSSTD